jgi:hypothetical protein
MYVDPSGEQGEYPPWVEGFRQCSGVGPKPPICNWWPWGKEHFVDELEEAGLDATQDALDTVGLVPGAGEPADALNASISLLRGDTRRALLSCAAIIPLAGWGPTAAKHLGLGGYVLDNNILVGIHNAHRGLTNTGVDHLDDAALTFAQRRNGFLYYTPTARDEFLRRHSLAEFDELVQTYNLQALQEPMRADVHATMNRLGITASGRYNDISYLVAARNNGFGLVTGDRRLLGAALRDGYWDVEFRFFTPLATQTADDVVNAYNSARRTIQQNAPGVDLHKITGGR